jgi:hypothetical protein
MRIFILVCVLFAAASFRVQATSSIGYSGEPFSVQLVGRDFDSGSGPLVEVSMPKGPRTLPSKSYRMTSYVYGKSLKLAFENRDDDPALPPSFLLTVCGNDATLVVADRTYRDCFGWLDDHSDCRLIQHGGAPTTRKVASPECVTGT